MKEELLGGDGGLDILFERMKVFIDHKHGEEVRS